jgi:hypothetical protein
LSYQGDDYWNAEGVAGWAAEMRSAWSIFHVAVADADYVPAKAGTPLVGLHASAT